MSVLRGGGGGAGGEGGGRLCLFPGRCILKPVGVYRCSPEEERKIVMQRLL